MAPVSTGPGFEADGRADAAREEPRRDGRPHHDGHVGPPVGQRVDDGDLAHGVPEAVPGHVEDDRHQYSPGDDAPADLAPVGVVGRAEAAPQRSLLERHGDDEIGGADGREDEASGGHVGRRPDQQHPAQIDRMPDEPVGASRDGIAGLRRFRPQPGQDPDVDAARRVEGQDAAGELQRAHRPGPRRRHAVDGAGDRPPGEADGDEQEACHPDVGWTLQWRGDQAGDAGLHRLAGEHAVVEGEDAEQQGVDEQALDQRSFVRRRPERDESPRAGGERDDEDHRAADDVGARDQRAGQGHG